MLKNLISICLCLGLAIGISMMISHGFPKVQLMIFPKPSIYEPKVNNKSYDWTGPPMGKKIDLSRLNSLENMPLSNNVKNDLIMIVHADPLCRMSQVTVENMKNLQAQAFENNIDYVLVSFNPEQSSKELSSFFVDKYGLYVDTYTVKPSEDDIFLSLEKLVSPTHILVDKSGVILAKFPGSNYEKQAREEMMEEIRIKMLEVKANYHAEKQTK